MNKSLDAAAIAALLKADAAKPARSGGGGARKPKTTASLPREYPTWFKLVTVFGSCDNPDCGDPRPEKVEEGNTMVADIDGKNSCRYCFLAGWLSPTPPTNG